MVEYYENKYVLDVVSVKLVFGIIEYVISIYQSFFSREMRVHMFLNFFTEDFVPV